MNSALTIDLHLRNSMKVQYPTNLARVVPLFISLVQVFDQQFLHLIYLCDTNLMPFDLYHKKNLYEYHINKILRLFLKRILVILVDTAQG